MSGTTQRPANVGPVSYARDTEAVPTAWVGWIFFAGVMMVLLGAFQTMMGLTALVDDGYFLVAPSGLVVNVDYTVWGWVHLLLGILVFLAGFGVMVGQMWARVVGIIAAVVSAIVNVGFLAAYPVWTTVVIVLDVIVVYALAVHGREVKST